MPSTAELRQSAHEMILEWGGLGQLVRAGQARDATMAITDYTPEERNSIQVDDLTKIRISMIGLTGDPTPQDKIVFGGKLYSIYRKPRGPKPFNEIIYWDCDCLELDTTS